MSHLICPLLYWHKLRMTVSFHLSIESETWFSGCTSNRMVILGWGNLCRGFSLVLNCVNNVSGVSISSYIHWNWLFDNYGFACSTKLGIFQNVGIRNWKRSGTSNVWCCKDEMEIIIAQKVKKRCPLQFS